MLKSAEEILLDRTDARCVKAQLDLFWTVSGADPVALLTTFGNRIIAVHMKGGVNGPARPRWRG